MEGAERPFRAVRALESPLRSEGVPEGSRAGRGALALCPLSSPFLYLAHGSARPGAEQGKLNAGSFLLLAHVFH